MQNLRARCSLVIGMTLLSLVPAFAAPATQLAAGNAAAPGSESGKILILPFHETASANYAWVGKAIQQDLLADLTRATKAQVDAPSSAAPAQDAAAALDAAKQTGAVLVVYGQYQTVGGQMRITGQVLSASSPQPVGSISATGAVNDLFPLEDAVSGQVLRSLPANLLTIPIPPVAGVARPVGASAEPQSPAPPTSPALAPSAQYYSYTYPDYSSGPPSLYPNTYLDSPYYYGYPYYWYSIPYYGPDIFFYFGRDHFHHHHHDWGPADHWHQGGIHDLATGGRFGAIGTSHAPVGRASGGHGGGGFHGGGGGGGFHGGGQHR